MHASLHAHEKVSIGVTKHSSAAALWFNSGQDGSTTVFVPLDHAGLEDFAARLRAAATKLDEIAGGLPR